MLLVILFQARICNILSGETYHNLKPAVQLYSLYMFMDVNQLVFYFYLQFCLQKIRISRKQETF
jgi:hypothetical protein